MFCFGEFCRWGVLFGIVFGGWGVFSWCYGVLYGWVVGGCCIDRFLEGVVVFYGVGNCMCEFESVGSL